MYVGRGERGVRHRVEEAIIRGSAAARQSNEPLLATRERTSMFSKSIAGAQQESSLYLWQKLSGWGCVESNRPSIPKG